MFVRQQHQSIAQFRSYRRERRQIDDSRDKRDACDAVNLSVVLKQRGWSESREAAAAAGKEHYVLMTLTGPVVYTSKEVAKLRMHRWLAVYPRQLLIPYILGFGENRQVGLARAKTIRDNLRELGSKLEDQVEWSRSPEFADFLKAEGDRVQQLLDELQGTTSTLVTGEFVSVERVRAPLLSVEHAHHRQLTSPESDMPGLNPKFMGYLKILDRLSKRLKTIEGYRYNTVPVQVPPRARFKQFEIRPAVEADNEESYLVIRIHLDTDNKPRFWTGCWDITCDEQDFLHSLNKRPGVGVWSTEVLEESPRQAVLSTLSADSKLWHEGIVVSTSVGAFGLHPQVVTCERSWLALSLPRLEVHLKRFLKENQPQYSHVRPEIQEIRINTMWADIVFDIAPAEGVFRRRLTVLSDKRICGILAHLHDRLGTRLTVKSAIESACEEVLQGFSAVDIPPLKGPS